MNNRISNSISSLAIRQSGFTLIEVMIASILGLIVIGGMYSLFAVNKETVRVQSSLGLAQERANFALNVIADDIRMAGWPGVFDPSGTVAFNDVINDVLVVDDDGRYDSIVLSRKGKGAKPASTDDLEKNGEVDCVGVIRDFDTVNAPLTHRYYVDEASQELRCQSLISGDEVAIIENVEAFQVLYGIDTVPGPCAAVDVAALSAQDAGAECMTPTLYVTGAQLPDVMQQAQEDFIAFGVNVPATAADLVPIKTIQLAIIVSTDETDIVNTDAATAQKYFLLNKTIGHGYNDADYSDGRANRFAMRTVALRQAFRGP
jgi:prepilin-type N-terminal cleavage/methylation domain-containing protein